MVEAGVTLPDERLSSWAKFKYGFAGLGAGMVDMPQQVLLVPFYTELFGVPPYLAGLLALITGACEAVSDPLLGYLSDRTRTRFGRRRPYLLAGAVPFGLSFWLLWNPVGDNPVASFLIAWLVFRLSITTLVIPIYSLGAEMSRDYDERTSIMSYFRGLVNLGLVVGVVVPLLLLRAFPSQTQAYGAMGLVLGTFLTVSMLVTFFGTRERRAAAPLRSGAGTRRALGVILASRAFWTVTLSGFLLAQAATAITSTMLVYFGLHWLKVGQADVLPATAAFLVVCLVSIPLVWGPASRRWDKKRALAGGLGVGALGALSLLFVPERGVTSLMAASGLFGLGFGAVQVLPYSMMAEVVDQTALATGERWEGLHYGISDFLRKLGVNLAVAVATGAISAFGYVPQGPQPEVVAQGIRYLTALGPALLCLAAALVVARYPLSRAAHARIHALLAEPPRSR